MCEAQQLSSSHSPCRLHIKAMQIRHARTHTLSITNTHNITSPAAIKPCWLMTEPTCFLQTLHSYLQTLTLTHTHMLTHTITLSFSLSTTFNSLWKRQVQTLIEPEPDLAPALSVRPAVLSNPLRSMSSQPGSQQAGSQASSHSTRLHPAGRGGLRLSPGPRYSRASLGSLGRPQRGIAQCQALWLHYWC